MFSIYHPLVRGAMTPRPPFNGDASVVLPETPIIATFLAITGYLVKLAL